MIIRRNFVKVLKNLTKQVEASGLKQAQNIGFVGLDKPSKKTIIEDEIRR